MKYAKFINGEIEFAPKNKVICGIEIEPSKNVMLKKGFKPLLDIQPTYDEETQYLLQDNYTEDEENIFVKYIVKDIFEQTTIEQTVTSLNKKVEELQEDNLNLLNSNFDLDFRVFEIELLIEELTDTSEYSISLASENLNNTNKKRTIRIGDDKMALNSVYQQAKRLILLGAYEKEDMTYKLTKYLSKDRITQQEYDELLSLMEVDSMTEILK